MVTVCQSRAVFLIYLSIQFVYSKGLSKPNVSQEGTLNRTPYKDRNHELSRTATEGALERQIFELGKSTHRQGRQSRIISPVTSQLNSGYYPPPQEYSHSGQNFYNQVPYTDSVEEVSNALESPLYVDQPHHEYEEDVEHHEIVIDLPEAPEDDDTEPSEDDDATTEQTTTEATMTTTTTLAPFTLADVKVPAPFLRIEYMISFTFFGMMYGLGFFVLFQSLCVPAAKLAVYIVYMALLTLGVVHPVTLEQALEQLPPT